MESRRLSTKDNGPIMRKRANSEPLPIIQPLTGLDTCTIKPKALVKFSIRRGDQEPLFIADKRVICNLSPFFDKAFKGAFLEAQAQTMFLENVEPLSFEAFLRSNRVQKSLLAVDTNKMGEYEENFWGRDIFEVLQAYFPVCNGKCARIAPASQNFWRTFDRQEPHTRPLRSHSSCCEMQEKICLTGFAPRLIDALTKTRIWDKKQTLQAGDGYERFFKISMGLTRYTTRDISICNSQISAISKNRDTGSYLGRYGSWHPNREPKKSIKILAQTWSLADRFMVPEIKRDILNYLDGDCYRPTTLEDVHDTYEIFERDNNFRRTILRKLQVDEEDDGWVEQVHGDAAVDMIKHYVQRRPHARWGSDSSCYSNYSYQIK